LITHDLVEFYLTHNCNLACSNCNRFNNFQLSGMSDWAANKSLYENLSKKVRFKTIVILGGEPLLHPQICEILDDIKTFWQNSNIEIHTNGLIFSKLKNLEVVEKIIKNKINLRISIHNKSNIRLLTETIKKLFEIKKTNVESNDVIRVTHYIKQNFRIELWQFEHFHNTALHKINGEFYFYNNDQKETHDICDMKNCHEIYNGKIYKCGFVLTAPELLKKINVNLSEEEKKLIHNYKPIDLQNLENIEEQLNLLSQPIAQCKFCPKNYTFHKIEQKNP